jgi:formate-dependent nitrite reductase cytochrome c552 subunit
MDLLKNKTNQELHKSLLAEVAKAKKELKDAQSDVSKAQSRLGFTVAALNELINRGND